MKGKCDKEGDVCFHDTPCAMGHTVRKNCEHWKPLDEPQATDGNVPDPSTDFLVSWTGRTLGTQDLIKITSRGSAILVGSVGAANAGKTTLLMSIYLHLLQGKTICGGRFAGSLTLGAWEGLAAYARWSGDVFPPSFPPHTTSDQQRMPGQLHFSLRCPQNRWMDILLTDAPGEWFTAWSNNESTTETRGATWVAENADVFILFADCERLAGPDRGKARGELLLLIDRLRNHVNRRPVLLLWSKDETDVPPEIQSRIEESATRSFPIMTQIRTSIRKPDTFLNAITSAINTVLAHKERGTVVEPVIEHTPFGAFRGRR